MDQQQLKKELAGFVEKSKDLGRPIEDMCILPAYPGDISTSYIIQVKAQWVDDMSCSQALDFLLGVLWDTTPIEIRTKVFSIQVLDSQNSLHCIGTPEPELETA